jgi:hypothetical protein
MDVPLVDSACHAVCSEATYDALTASSTSATVWWREWAVPTTVPVPEVVELASYGIKVARYPLS